MCVTVQGKNNGKCDHVSAEAARVMLGSFPLNQLEQTPEICLMWSLNFVQSLRIMALTVFNASCLAKWPWCEVDDDDTKACCDEGDDVMIASGSEASEGCVDRLAWAI